MRVKTIVLVVLSAVWVGGACAEEETVASLTKKIAAKENEKKKIDKVNPCVVFAEENNPSMNVKKTMDRRNGKYPKGVIEVNQTFFCPIHKVSSPCIKGYHGKEWCKKGNFARAQWMNLKTKIGKTAECDEKVESLQAEIAELKERLVTMKEKEKVAKKKAQETAKEKNE